MLRVSEEGISTSKTPTWSFSDEEEEVWDEEFLQEHEELWPLKDALKRAVQKKSEAILFKEALEAEAQEVAQQAIKFQQAVEKARRRAVEAAEELVIGERARANLQLDVDALRSQVAAESASAEEAPAAAEAAAVLEPVIEGAAIDEDEKPDIPPPAPTAEQALAAREDSLAEVDLLLTELRERVRFLEERALAAVASAEVAEEVASSAMRAAGAGVQDEMEAAAVVKETQAALSKALRQVKSIMPAEELASVEEERAAQLKAAQIVATIEATLAADGPLSEAVTSTTFRDADSDIRSGENGARATATTYPVETKSPASMASFDEWRQKEASKANPVWQNKKVLAAVVLVAAVAMWGISLTPLSSVVESQLNAVYTYIFKLQQLAKGMVARIPIPATLAHEQGLIETIWLLLTTVLVVPAVCKLPGGSPVLGFLAGGALIGPHALGIVRDVEGVRHLAELGVVFLLFNIGLELSLERLRSMQKFVFGLGSAQVLVTTVAIAFTAMQLSNVAGPCAIILGGGLALSSTAVAMQVLQDRSETGTRHGRATFSVLLFQDLAVVVLLMLIPLLAPSDSGAAGMSQIAKALGLAAVKAVVCITAIIAGGRVVLRPIYRRISALNNAEIFAACTLLVVLGTSVITQAAGLSLALGAFLAGLLLAETEFAMQVESDIAAYKGLLMGLFFMTVGMEISVGLFFAKYKLVLSAMALLIGGKVAMMAGLGPLFGISWVQSVRAGLLLAAGGEFAFVAFGEAVSHKILSPELAQLLFLVVALSMALTPFLAEAGQKVGKAFGKNELKALQPSDSEAAELRDHVIIAGFGRVGQIIAQLLSERLIPFVALDVIADRVQAGKELDLPVFYGDAGSPAVLHSVRAHHAKCAVITLNTPGANYRAVWALNKHFPHVKTYVRAHDVEHGIILEKAGATAVVPETLEPSLQLAAAILSQLSMPPAEVASAIENFRKNHLSELQALSFQSGASLGYGFATKSLDDDTEDEEDLEHDYAMLDAAAGAA